MRAKQNVFFELFFFEIKDIHINSDIDEKLAKDISSSLAEFYYSNIFSVNMIEIKKKHKL